VLLKVTHYINVRYKHGQGKLVYLPQWQYVHMTYLLICYSNPGTTFNATNDELSNSPQTTPLQYSSPHADNFEFEGLGRQISRSMDNESRSIGSPDMDDHSREIGMNEGPSMNSEEIEEWSCEMDAGERVGHWLQDGSFTNVLANQARR